MTGALVDLLWVKGSGGDLGTLTGTESPRGAAAVVRCILDSLAAAYARAVDDATRLSGRQARALGAVRGTLPQLRGLVTGTQPLTRYLPGGG